MAEKEETEAVGGGGGGEETELKKELESFVKTMLEEDDHGWFCNIFFPKETPVKIAEKEEPEAAGGGGGGKETELKKELESLVKTMLEEDDYGIEKTVEAIRILNRLNELKLKKPIGLGLDDSILSEMFKCYLSGEIMGDPVVLASGQTYDRPYIENWLSEGNLTCPRSKQVLSHSILTPNCLVQELISCWCKGSVIAVPESHQDVGGETITKMDRILLNSLLGKMSSSRSDQKEAAKELRRLTKAKPSYRAVFCELPDAISRLLSPLSENRVELVPGLQEDLITTLLNLSIHDNNKKAVAENPVAVRLLIESMKFGTTETRKNAAAALFTLSALDSNKLIIGNSRAPEALLELLRGGHPLEMKDAASAILNLCMNDENKKQFIEIGAVEVILQKIKESILVDELLRILALLSTHVNAVEQLSEVDTVHCLLRIIRDSNSRRTKENCVAVLFAVCWSNKTMLKALWKEEMRKKTLAELADTGTRRARRKADGLIARMCKTFPTVRRTAT
ncbi:hypothetical protein GQ457_11G006600 [Hibiscus cannabinus]